VYYAKLGALDSTAVATGPPLDGAIVPMRLTAHYGQLVRYARRQADSLLFSPDTEYLAFDWSLERPSLASLPYASAGAIKPEHYSDPRGVARLVGAATQLQEDLGADQVIAPCLLPESDNHVRFNLRLLRETLETTRSPVVAVLYLPYHTYSDPSAMAELVTEYGRLRVTEYHVVFDGFVETQSPLSTCQAVVQAVRQLVKAGLPVLISSMGLLGMMLMQEGTQGTCSSIVWTDRFRSGAIRKPQGGPARGVPRTRYEYVPEMLSALLPWQVEQLTRRGVLKRCVCPQCARGRPADDGARKAHLLYRRVSEMSDLGQASLADRRDMTADRLRKAEEVASNVTSAIPGIDVSYLTRWKRALGVS